MRRYSRHPLIMMLALFLLVSLLLAASSPAFSKAEDNRSAINANEMVSDRGAISPPRQEPDPDALQRLIDDTGGTAQVSLNKATGVASFVRLPQSVELPSTLSARTPANARASAFFAQYGGAFGISDTVTELRYVGSHVDGYGNTQVVYQQVYQGVEVFAGVLKVHMNDRNEITAVNGTFVPKIKVRSTPDLNADEASRIAVDTVAGLVGQRNASHDLSAVNSQLYVYASGLTQSVTGPVHLVYEVEVTNPVLTVREFVYVDAHTGAVVDRISGIHDADPDREVSETSLANVVWDESAGHPDPIPAGWAGGTVQQVTDWQNEIDGAAETYYLFASMAGRDSYDGAGATMRTVNNDPGISCPNANWNGTSTNYCSNVTGDDTVAHEWGHAYTEYTNNLIYQWQSGALNESYSDIWGETVDLLNGRGLDAPDVTRASNTCSSNAAGANFPGNPTVDTVRWLSGEDDPAFFGIPAGSGNAIRDMWDPTCFGDPGKVTDTAQYICTTTDSGGVHTNSGIPNHAFALMVDGGDYNGQTITALGLTKAAHIHWAAQNMLTPASNFIDHANALEAACSALIGVDLPALSTSVDNAGLSGQMITAADCQEVSEVIAAVEFRTEPTFCGFETLLDPDAPALCEGLGTVESILFEDWEGGSLPAGWTVGSHDVANPATFDTPDWDVVGSLPSGANGAFAAFVPDLIIGDCAADDESGALFLDSPVITIPAGSGVPRVAFDHWVATELGWDGGNVKVSVNGGPWTLVPSSAFDFNPYNMSLNSAGAGNTNPLASEGAFTGTDGGAVSGSWGQSQVDLSGFARPGDEVQFRFDFGVDGCNGVIGWYVDDVQVYSCSEEEAPPAIDVDPDSLSPMLSLDEIAGDVLTISNIGEGELNWEITEDNQPPALLSASGLATDRSVSQAGQAVAASQFTADTAFSSEGLAATDKEASVIGPGIFTITHSASQTVTPGNSVWCPAAPGNSYLRVFDLVNEFDITSTFDVMEVEVGIQVAVSVAGSQDVTVNLYTLEGPLVYANMTLIGTATTSIVDQALSIVTVPVTGSSPPGSVLVVEVYAPANNVTSALLIGSNALGETSPSYIVGPACGITEPIPFASIGFPGIHVVMNVTGEVGDDFLTCTNPTDIPWLSVAPTSGTTLSGAPSEVTVTYDPTGLAPGTYESTLCIDSNAANTPRVQVPVNLTVLDNHLPVCSTAVPSRDTLWPPNHKFKSIDVLNVTDPDGDPVTITIDSIFQDERVRGPGRHHPDGRGIGTSTAEVRAERDGRGNGRVYHIYFTADDGQGGMCTGEVLVGVPHDRHHSPIDGGPLYDSTIP